MGGVTLSGIDDGVAFVPAVPGLAPWGFYGGEREGLPVPIEPASQASERQAAEAKRAWSESSHPHSGRARDIRASDCSRPRIARQS